MNTIPCLYIKTSFCSDGHIRIGYADVTIEINYSHFNHSKVSSGLQSNKTKTRNDDKLDTFCMCHNKKVTWAISCSPIFKALMTPLLSSFRAEMEISSLAVCL